MVPLNVMQLLDFKEKDMGGPHRFITNSLRKPQTTPWEDLRFRFL